MMPADKVPAKQANSENHASGNRKNGAPRPPEPALKCPRCDSPNTKFCYYNNYNLSQPRHFCKTCRRYWTKGGALRNVPVGGGCRKNKKIKSSSRLYDDSKDSAGGSFDSADFNMFHHGVAPSMEYHHQYGRLPFSRLNSPCSTSVYNQLFSFGDLSSTGASVVGAGTMTNPSFDIDGARRSSSTSLLGLSSSFPVTQGDQGGGYNWGIQDNSASMNVNNNIASSIESLSCINQDLHWRLQQQRLAMLYGGGGGGDNNNNSNKDVNVDAVGTTSTAMSCTQGDGIGILQNQVPQPILFQNLEISKPETTCGGVGNSTMRSGVNTTEWLFENSYTPPTTTTTTTSSNSNGNEGMMSNWNGVQAWSGMHPY